jgi:hypothetical protein
LAGSTTAAAQLTTIALSGSLRVAVWLRLTENGSSSRVLSLWKIWLLASPMRAL